MKLRWHGGKMGQKMILGGAVATMVLAGGLPGPTPARAETVTTLYGVPGSVELPVVQADYAMSSTTVALPSRQAWRSPATEGDQLVVLNARLQWFSRISGWTVEQQLFVYAVIVAGQSSAPLPGLAFHTKNFGHYKIDFSVAWGVNGTMVGALLVDLNAVDDYQCVAPQRYCHVDDNIDDSAAVFLAL